MARACVSGMPRWRPRAAASGDTAASSMRLPTRWVVTRGASSPIFAGNPEEDFEVSAPPLRNGTSAASLLRPISRMSGRWCAGISSISAWSSSRLAQRAPGRQPPPRGQEQSSMRVPGSPSAASSSLSRKATSFARSLEFSGSRAAGSQAESPPERCAPASFHLPSPSGSEDDLGRLLLRWSIRRSRSMGRFGR